MSISPLSERFAALLLRGEEDNGVRLHDDADKTQTPCNVTSLTLYIKQRRGLNALFSSIRVLTINDAHQNKLDHGTKSHFNDTEPLLCLLSASRVCERSSCKKNYVMGVQNRMQCRSNSDWSMRPAMK
jgi:hypothetical protein